MSPQAKKTSWLSVGLVGLIITAIGIAYSAGINTSASTHKIDKVEGRIDHCEEEVEAIKQSQEDFSKLHKKDVDSIKTHLHRIDLSMERQTVLLEEIKQDD